MDGSVRMFNKSFNDLHFIQTMVENVKKNVFVFDFDLTMTVKSSNGWNKNNDFIELFDNQEKLDKLKNYFEKIVKSGNVIYINTVGLVTDVKYILTKSGFEIGENKMIKGIKGSESIRVISCPFTFDELIQYGLTDITKSKVLWGVKKVIFLNQIVQEEQIDPFNLLFFDDSIININTSNLNGYSNSFLIGSNDSGINGLDYLLIKLDQILEIFENKTN
jgi:hypothetical protein